MNQKGVCQGCRRSGCLIDFIVGKHGLSVDEMEHRLNDKQCDVNAVNGSNWTPLKAAIMTGGVDLIEVLVRHGAKIDGATLKFAEQRYSHKVKLCAYLLHHRMNNELNVQEGSNELRSRKM